MDYRGKRAAISASQMAWALALLLALCAAMALVGCQPDESSLVVRYDGGVVTEDEVSSYTADFRKAKGFEDDNLWAQYLFDNGMTTEDWRLSVAGKLVEERLVSAQAKSEGIVPDEERIGEQMAQDRAAAGIAEGDDAAWAEHLASLGTTEAKYREGLEAASVESQLLAAHVGLDPVDDGAQLDAFMTDSANGLLSRIAVRYRVLCYDTEAAAQAALDELSALSGDALAARFDELVELDDSAETTADNGGDIGWDIAQDLGQMQQELNEELLEANRLSARVHEVDGKFYVAMSTDRYVFTSGSTYDALPDDELKAFVLRSATYSLWNQMVQDYITGLRESAHVQYREPSRSLPYDVDEEISVLKAQVKQ